MFIKVKIAGSNPVESTIYFKEVICMPYRSKKQRRYMHAKHPKIAKRWDRKYGGKVRRKKKK